MSTSTQQLRKTCTTHKPRIGSIHFDWCSQSVTLVFSLSRQPIPHKLHWPLRTQNPRGSTTKSSCSVPTLQNRIPKKIVPPPTVIDHHKTTHDQIFWRLHLSFNFLLSKANAVYFFLPKSESRLFGLSPFAVTFGYAPMSIQLNCRE